MATKALLLAFFVAASAFCVWRGLHWQRKASAMQPSLARKAAYERFRWWTIATAGFVGFGLLALYLALSPPAEQFKLR